MHEFFVHGPYQNAALTSETRTARGQLHGKAFRIFSRTLALLVPDNMLMTAVFIRDRAYELFGFGITMGFVAKGRKTNVAAAVCVLRASWEKESPVVVLFSDVAKSLNVSRMYVEHTYLCLCKALSLPVIFPRAGPVCRRLLSLSLSDSVTPEVFETVCRRSEKFMSLLVQYVKKQVKPPKMAKLRENAFKRETLWVSSCVMAAWSMELRGVTSTLLCDELDIARVTVSKFLSRFKMTDSPKRVARTMSFDGCTIRNGLSINPSRRDCSPTKGSEELIPVANYSNVQNGFGNYEHSRSVFPFASEEFPSIAHAEQSEELLDLSSVQHDLTTAESLKPSRKRTDGSVAIPEPSTPRLNSTAHSPTSGDSEDKEMEFLFNAMIG